MYCVPHYNRVRLLAETLDSIVRQSVQPAEVIIVDDHSDPSVQNELQQFLSGKVRILLQQPGLSGPSAARNTGWRASSCSLIMFVDSDDLLAPFCLEERIRCIQKSADSDFWVFPVGVFLERIGDQRTLWNNLCGDHDLERFLRSDPVWHTSGPIWKKCALERIGGFNEQVSYGDDSDLSIRALLAGLLFQKFPLVAPDTFVRRSDHNRITNDQTDRALDARRTRLYAGSDAVKDATPVQKRLWAGQYFVECEYLLFRVSDSLPRQMEIWRQHWIRHRPGIVTQVLVAVYLQLSNRLKETAYLVLRILRRLLMLVLDPACFPSGAGIKSTEMSEAQWARLAASIAEAGESLPQEQPQQIIIQDLQDGDVRGNEL